MLARDIMTTNPVVVTPNDLVSTAARIMRDRDIGCVPVVDDPTSLQLLGVITDRDITIRCTAASHGADCPVREHMSTGALDTVTPDAEIHVVLQKMEQDQIRRIPVVEDGMHLVGIIAQADIATRLGASEPKTVEELVELISQPAPLPA